MGERNCRKESVMRWLKMNWKLDKTKIKVGGMFKGILARYFNFSFRDKDKRGEQSVDKRGLKGG